MTQYKLVPVEPTQEMITVGTYTAEECIMDDPCQRAGLHVWQTMISAAPPSPDPYKALEVAREALEAARTILFPKTTSGEIVLSWNDVRVTRDKLGEALYKIDEVMK